MRKWLTISAAGLFSLAVAGCDPQIETACPALKNYSAAAQQRLAAEYAALPNEAKAMIRDYSTLRKMCRALAKK
jgi:outer membrane murein-binding lipoprotein Lpp